MKAIRMIVVALLCVLVVAMAAACVERASEAEVDQMCQRLVQLGGAKSGSTEAEALSKCKQDAAHERTFKTVAECRSKAADLDTFWNKCR